MNNFFKITAFLLLPFMGKAQVSRIDSLQAVYQLASGGEARYKAASNLYYYYQEINRDSALFYAEEQKRVSIKSNNKIGEGVAAVQKSYQLMNQGKYAAALKELQLSFSIAEDEQNEKQAQWDYFFTAFDGNKRLLLLSYTHHMYGLLMLNTENLEQQVKHFKIACEIGQAINYPPRVMLANLNLGASYLDMGLPDSALYFEKEAERIAQQADVVGTRILKTYYGTVQMHLGEIYEALEDDSMALASYHKSIHTAQLNNNRSTLYRVNHRMCGYYLRKGNKDSALKYALGNIQVLRSMGAVLGKETNYGMAYENIYRAYSLNNQFDSAFKYLQLALVTKDSLARVRIKNLAEFQNLTYNEQLRLQNLEKEKVVYRNRVRTYFLLGGIGVLLLLALLFYRNTRQKHRAKIRIEQAYDDLKATQQQLIQSEKMASLGELTAGIAHEIQNPLNFVNNFSEVNIELLAEMNEEISKGNFDEVKSIAKDITENEEKINHHGKRADGIVKGMLQHSRSSNGEKEPTDINALADEYFRLAYHGLRAKDKSFNAAMKTEFDPGISRISIIPQDIGRVILNLITNAFYAVNEKATLRQALGDTLRQAQGDNYEPIVTVKTAKITRSDGKKMVEIRVKDNGNGISPKVLDKIFQPFFTTKPTGQGTGLGLSLSYDIVKAHGGELKVETKEREGTTFIMQVPFN